MSDTDRLSVLLCSSRNLSHSSVTTGVAAPLEDSSLVVDDVDVDVSAEGHHARSRVDRVLVLVDEDGIIQSIGTLLVATKVVGIQEVCLAGLACNDTHSAIVGTRESRWKKLKWCRSKIFVCAVELSLLPWHEEVYR